MGSHDHAGHGDHGHGHANDQGFAAIVRYLKIAPRMWSSVVNDAVVDLIAPQSGETVVDVGAGMGPAAVRAAATGATVIAVEPTPFMRRVLSVRRLASRNRSGIEVRDGGAEALPLADGEADAVWAVNTMHHWISPAEGAVEIARILKPGGRVVLVDENFEDPAHPDHARWQERHQDDGEENATEDGGHGHHAFSMVDATEIGDLMRAAGLTDIVAEERTLAGRPVIAVIASI